MLVITGIVVVLCAVVTVHKLKKHSERTSGSSSLQHEASEDDCSVHTAEFLKVCRSIRLLLIMSRLEIHCFS